MPDVQGEGDDRNEQDALGDRDVDQWWAEEKSVVHDHDRMPQQTKTEQSLLSRHIQQPHPPLGGGPTLRPTQSGVKGRC